MSEVKNNHVQISKFLMRPFSHKTNDGEKVYFLDFNTKQINEEKIKKLGTSPEYYSSNVEEYLNREVESKVGDVLKSLKDVTDKNENATISETDVINIKRLFTYAFIRSPKFKEQVLSESVFLQFFSDRDQHNLILGFPESVAKHFDNFFVNIIINKSKKGGMFQIPCILQNGCNHK